MMMMISTQSFDQQQNGSLKLVASSAGKCFMCKHYPVCPHRLERLNALLG